ncbi:MULTISPECIES: ankyrin repeat domain-containing protein [Rhodococcus]|uniref:ankyrin repeat domain-containing protein n=1 Tax=Rhodococcus TaxID=1827 RepID=UPI001F2C581E|nr:ankyrin repeat domain-containing protein [Rhodococcus globerulus]
MNRKSGIVLVAGVVLAVAGCGSAASPATSPSASVASAEASTSSEPSVASARSTPESERALIAATKSNDVEVATALILAGADVNAKDSIQDSAFLYAGAEGLNQILALTLSHGADVRSVNRFGGTALIPASEHAHVDTVRMLIAAGVPVNHINDPGWTALLEAVVYGDGSPRYLDVITQLLDAGADQEIRDARGRTALENAQNLGQADVAALLTSRR